MSVIAKIREKSGVAVVVVALGLILFLVGGDILGPNSALFGNNQDVGQMAGDDIDAKEFQNRYQVAENDYLLQNQGKAPGEQERNGIREQAWNQLIFEKVYKPEFDKLGLMVTEEEQVDMVQGFNIHPAIKQAFTDPQTGQFNKAQIVQFLANFKQVQPQQRAAWLNFESKLPDDRLRSKYENLINKTGYVTRLEAMREYVATNSKVDAQYLMVNFATIPDSSIKVEDAELSAYLKDHQSRYKVQENRSIDYVQWMIRPSRQDSTFFNEELAKIKTEFEAADNDTNFAAGYSDNPVKMQSLGPNDLPAELSSQAGSLVKGGVYGPFIVGASSTLYKVADIRTDGAASAKASHILFKAEGNDSAKAASRAKANQILAQIKAGASFEDMARQHGTDGTAQQGGDLGWFTQDRMVKPFADAVFNMQGIGLLPELVVTEFGYHIIKVTAPKTSLKYNVVAIQKNISAGDESREALYTKASQFKTGATNKAAYDELVTQEKLEKMTATAVYKNGNGINDIQDARDLTRWAYDEKTNVGDVSELKELNDRYVVAILNRKTDEGDAKVDDVRDALKAELLKKKKYDQIMAKLGTGTFEDMQKRYGTGAVVNTVADQAFNNNALMDIGYDPIAIGKLFGLKINTPGKPFQGESGVTAFKVTKKVEAPAVDKNFDVTTFKQQIDQRNQGRTQYFITEAMKELAKVKDDRLRFF